MNLSKKAFIIYGPPGAGKGTQAELLAKRFQFIHFDTGRFIETLLNSEEANKDELLVKEKKRFDSGELNTPSWVLGIVKKSTINISNAGMSLIFSGSPRTVFEAFGDEDHVGLLDVLKEEYGQSNIKILFIDIKRQTSIKRNSSRLICSLCGLPILASAKITKCAFCGAKARKRTLDNPDIIKNRWIEYKERTFPIIKKMTEKGYNVINIDGEHSPEDVHRIILEKTNLA